MRHPRDAPCSPVEVEVEAEVEVEVAVAVEVEVEAVTVAAPSEPGDVGPPPAGFPQARASDPS